MKQKYYKQCKFKLGDTKRVAWVEERGAEVGKLVAFKEDPEFYWEVVSVGERRITEEQAKKLGRRNVQFQGSLK